ncbi:hypothetical protein [Rhizobium sp. BK068]|uniref:hypothetical protein n=1 Tax=Rhizobium sp. BK068 TaxID=2512130 RepID=UPI001051CD7C|nr:hypothetical protein [Rhizobium sp. BK068]TCM76622.1 hypothetical protein EV291_10940 [Rhizobium sp. BK068]
MRIAFVSLALLLFSTSIAAAESCPAFKASTMVVTGIDPVHWRTDYPRNFPNPRDDQPWESIKFRNEPTKYMQAVLDTARPFFKNTDGRLTGTGSEPWWISEWLDYGTSGREALMGLTKERGPKAGDLSETSTDGAQVWAVGFYNTSGAAVFGEIFAEPCNPSLPVNLKFPDDTASIKFLFTDASTDEVPYLKDAPVYNALIDPLGSSSQSLPVGQRTKRPLRLLQVDIAVKDSRSFETGWVFGTFVWRGPPKGDQLFDNLVPVSLQWGNDPGVYDDQSIKQSWVNADLNGVTFGWAKRPSMGFMGRANGPADNVRSSCLSCHSAARSPRASIGLLGSSFNMEHLDDTQAVKRHVDIWFQNIKSGQLFQPTEPAAATLDYSLQLEAAAFRVCSACEAGDLTGPTPSICRSTGFYNRPKCSSSDTATPVKRLLQSMAPPRQ